MNGLAPRADLVVRGGTLVDPDGAGVRTADVTIDGGLITAIEERAVAVGRRELDAGGLLVLPGLVDLHTHCVPGATYWGIDPTRHAWRSGVTSWVDAGSLGAATIAGARHHLERASPLRTRAFLNASPAGLVARTGEFATLDTGDWSRCVEAIDEHRDVVVGVKVRLDAYNEARDPLAPLEIAVRAARARALPVMVHVGAAPPPIDAVLDRLERGDLVTHCTTGQSMALVEPDGALRPATRRARARGVLLDVGHGAGAFSFAVAEALLAADAPPDTISSDAHVESVRGPMFDLATCMTKFLALGLGLAEIVRAVTSRPALVAGLEAKAGTIAVGRRGDLAIFRLEEAPRRLFDVYLESRLAERFFVNVATVLGGDVLGPPRGAREEERAPLVDRVGAAEWPRPDLEGPIIA